mgnify:FL=1
MINKKNITLLILGILILLVFQINSSKIIVENVATIYKYQCGSCIKINESIFSFNKTYSIKISADGFEEGNFNLSHENGLNIVNLQPMKVLVEILFKEFPINASFKINNNSYQINSEVRLDPGKYLFSVDSDNYFFYEEMINISASNKTHKINLDEYKIKKPIKIIHKYETIKINGREINNDDDIIYLKSKNNKITFFKKDKVLLNYDYTASNNDYEEINLNQLSNKIDKSILFETIPSGAAISVNKKYIGITPIIIKDNDINLIKITFSGYEDLIIEPKEALKEKKYLYNLKPQLSLINIKSNLQAKILIDNEYIGDTPYEAKLKVGTYNITLIKEGYASINKKIIVDPGFNIEINERLITSKKNALINAKRIYKNSIGIELKLFDPTKIAIGSKISEKRRRRNEVLKNIIIDRHFYVSTHLVTEKAYKKINSQYKKNSELPVVNIAWNSAAIYCNMLSTSDGLTEFYKMDSANNVIGYNNKSTGYRMLSEAEWEYIASPKNGKTIYPWGNEPSVPTNVGNLSGEETIGKFQNYIKNYKDDIVKSSEIKSFEPNQNKIYDIVGNVSEWVHDFYSEDFFTSDTGELYNYMGPNFGNSHVIKGSNYQSSNRTELGISYREGQIEASSLIGFRVARWIY